MLKLYIPEPISGKRLVPFIADAPQGGGRLFQDLPEGSFKGIYERVSAIEACDAVLLPHEYALLRKQEGYLRDSLQKADAAQKITIISAYQDDPAPIAIPHTRILRSSAYKSTLLSHEILMPAYVEDLGARYGFSPLPKGTLPTVGFMGKADFATPRDAARYYLRNYLLRRGAHREGLYFRRKAIRALQNDKRIVFSGVARRSFSAHKNSAELPPDVLREEYVRSIQDHMLTLAPRGDGNYSLRFYETLSLGRIPLLIDTDMPLPLEGHISYDSFILRVPFEDVDQVANYVHDFWHTHTEESLHNMQERARNAFSTMLAMPAFLRKVLTRDGLNLP